MSIKTELSKKYKEDQKQRERELETQAREFITEFLENKFRQLNQVTPMKTNLIIKFKETARGCQCYNYCLGDEKVPYSYNVVKKARELVKEYEIDDITTEGGEAITFALELDNA